MVVLPGEEELGPGGPALLVVRPLHLVEHEHLAPIRRHLDGAAEDRRVLVDPLLARDEADPVGAEQRPESPVRLLREHPQRAGVDAAPLLGEKRERVVGLARVRRAEVRDDCLRLAPPLREADCDAALGPVHCGTPVGTRGASVASRARGALGRPRAAAPGHERTRWLVASATKRALRPSGTDAASTPSRARRRRGRHRGGSAQSA